ncbi:MAG: DUF2971 domain-containing protein [Clostridia bacterium]|nr:DUF2971 domain-containing protein [Clostridia bacterium]
MSKKTQDAFRDTSFWLDLCWMYVSAALLVALKVSWKILVIIAVICGLIALLKIRKEFCSLKNTRKLEKKFYKALKEARKQGNMTMAYKAIDTEILPELRKELPTKIYKYYRLDENITNNQMRLDTLKENSIWASVPSFFNDPFECQFMYLDKEDLKKSGFPLEIEKIWNQIMSRIRQHITTICFSQNPNDMPMWAYYANEHRGFCVEYEIVNKQHLYPVLYAENRINTQNLFVEMIYGLFNPEATSEEITSLFKHLLLLCAFKDKSWKAENEIRAIFLNPSDEINNNGKRCTCEEVGVKPTKIYIGVQCSNEHSEELKKTAEELKIAYEVCQLSTGKIASVINEQENFYA